MLAILQCADTGPLESLVVMLRAVDIDCALPDAKLRDELRRLGCDTVIDPAQLTDSWGYDPPMELPTASTADMSRTDVLYVDVKAHRNGPKVWAMWSHLEKRTLWYRINGGKPEHVRKGVCDACDGEGSLMYQMAKERCLELGGHKVDTDRGTWYYVTKDEKSIEFKTIGGDCTECRGKGCQEDHGDEVNPPCPVLTPNRWYSTCLHCQHRNTCTFFVDPGPCEQCGARYGEEGPNADPRFYSCWPPFHRFKDYDHPRGQELGQKRYAPPVCFVHNLAGWGYGPLVEPMRELGVRMHGVRSPDGLVQHREVPALLSRTLAYVHLKSSDAPGYALYEALAAACPVVCTRKLIWKCRMQELLVPGVTCLAFDRETHAGFTPEDITECAREVREALGFLSFEEYNRKVGDAGRAKLLEVMWRPDRDAASLGEFIATNFDRRR